MKMSPLTDDEKAERLEKFERERRKLDSYHLFKKFLVQSNKSSQLGGLVAIIKLIEHDPQYFHEIFAPPRDRYDGLSSSFESFMWTGLPENKPEPEDPNRFGDDLEELVTRYLGEGTKAVDEIKKLQRSNRFLYKDIGEKAQETLQEDLEWDYSKTFDTNLGTTFKFLNKFLEKSFGAIPGELLFKFFLSAFEEPLVPIEDDCYKFVQEVLDSKYQRANLVDVPSMRRETSYLLEKKFLSGKQSCFLGVYHLFDLVKARRILAHGEAEDLDEILHFSRLNIPDYDVIARLGEGKGGQTYKVVLRVFDQVRVLKVLENEDHAQKEFEAYKRIARVGSLPHVVTVFHAGYELGGERNIVMEYMQDGTLADQLYEFLPLETIIDWNTQILKGIEGLEKLNIVHGDLRPHNIGLSNGVLKIFDFGKARKVGEEGEGSRSYAAPSVIKQNDYFSLGLILYEMLTAEHLFDFQSRVIRKGFVPLMRKKGVNKLNFSRKDFRENAKSLYYTSQEAQREYNDQINTNLPERLSGAVIACLDPEPDPIQIESYLNSAQSSLSK